VGPSRRVLRPESRIFPFFRTLLETRTPRAARISIVGRFREREPFACRPPARAKGHFVAAIGRPPLL